jgi:RNA 2',3'-cyclic 3'-phosphodiesterase
VTVSGSVEGDERLRLFLGFPLPATAVRKVARWQEHELGAPPGTRVVPAANLHVTIAFLGSRPAAEVASIAAALRDAVEGVAPPVLSPLRYRETRSVGMLVFADDEERAARIAQAAHGGLARLGLYEPERRPWLPHLTVVRFRQRPRLQPPIPELGAVTMSDAAVYISRLRPTGAQYEVVESVPLGGG